VQHAALVRRRERLGHAPPEGDRLLDRERAAEQPLGELLALDPFHHQVRIARRRHPVVEVAHDPRVVELRQDARLALEARLLPLRALALQDLERGDARRAPIPHAIDRPHASSPREPFDFEPIREDISGLHTAQYRWGGRGNLRPTLSIARRRTRRAW
jgi:hypothetical protein